MYSLYTLFNDIKNIMRESNHGKTVGITLRLDKQVLDMYNKIALRANTIKTNDGGRGDVTAQDIIRHRLESLPLLKIKLGKRD